MSSPIKNVILFGAGGNLGPAILKQLLASSFNVSVLSRTESKSTFPTEVRVIKSDYSPSSLQSALKGQDAVVSAVGYDGLAAQQTIIDAAVSAGVKRFLPSEFGFDTTNPGLFEVLPFIKGKADVVEYLKMKEKGGLSWTALATGTFLDWDIGILWARGHEVTNLATVGKAVVALLSDKAYEKTKNTHVFISSHRSVTQNIILAALEKQTGQKWEIAERLSAKQKSAEALERLAKGDLDYSVTYTLIQAAVLGKVPEHEFGRLETFWNAELGLEEEENLDEDIKAILDVKNQ